MEEDGHIEITQAESKRAVAIAAHLNQIFRTAVTDEGGLLRPTAMDHRELLLSAASFRALLFDDTGQPVLQAFAQEHGLHIEIESVECNGNMLFLSVLAGDKGVHTSDFLLHVLADPECRDYFQLNVEREYLLVHQDAEIFRAILSRPELWLPESSDPQIGLSNFNTPSQLASITRRIVSLKEWGELRIGQLKDVPIRRKSILCYVANKLGGAHYDSKRLPSNDKANEFRVIAGSYDWDRQAFMHAGLVAAGVCCAEFVRAPQVRTLHHVLNTYHASRQERLSRGELLS